MEEKPFRVLLDFSEVNPGISGLKYVWMHVSPREFNTIYDFKQAIVRKFSFTQEDFKLFVRDGLLLEVEKIAILREDDTVKIQFESPIETSMECNATNTDVNIPVAKTSSTYLSSSAVTLNKSRKRKSETYVNTSRETDSLSVNLSKKKKKQDEIESTSDQSNNISRTEEPSISQLQEVLLSLDKNPISNSSSNKDENNKQPSKSKKRLYPKTPTSEFINLAVKLSEAGKKSQNICESDVNITNTKRMSQSISDTNLYKTAEIVSKTYLSPIPEKSHTFDLSSSKTPLNLTESYSNSESQVGGGSSIFDGGPNDKDVGKKRRRRKRKRKAIQSPEKSCLSTDVNTELDGSFLTEVKLNETYHTSSDARKHIIFHSPTSSSKPSSTKTLICNPNSSVDELKELSNEINNLKSDSGLDSSRNHSLQEESHLVVSEINDSIKESTPFSKKKLKNKSWGITPLPRKSSSSNTINMENSDISRSDGVKPPYQDCTPLNCLPPVGTRLAYKTLELNEEYCPEVTEYKEGILRKVDPNTDELEIELVQEEIKPGRSGKFENLWNDEPPPDQVVKTVSLNWAALIEPRLIP